MVIGYILFSICFCYGIYKLKLINVDKEMQKSSSFIIGLLMIGFGLGISRIIIDSCNLKLGSFLNFGLFCFCSIILFEFCLFIVNTIENIINEVNK